MVCLMVLFCDYVGAQTSQQEAYHRFQYRKFKWRTYHTEAFNVYFPYGYDSLCKYVVSELPEAMERVKHRMVTTLVKVPNVIIYPSPDQLYESNIGMYDQGDKTLPTFVSKGNRIVLFYNGSYTDLKAQLYEAIVRSIWEAQLNDELADQAKGGSKDAIPFWFSEGAIRYFAHNWPIHAEDELRRSFEQNRFTNWQQVIAYQPRLGGQAFCYFLADKFYEQSVQQLLGQLKKKKDLRRSIRLIAKRELDSLYVLCFDYYKQRFNSGTDSLTKDSASISIQLKKGILKGVLPANNEKDVTYVLSRNNKRTVYNYNSTSSKTTKLNSYKLPPWINDYSKDQYPLLKQDGQNGVLVTQPLKGKLTSSHFSNFGGRYAKNNLIGIDGVTAIQPDKNGQYLLSGYRKGQSDIVVYDANREQYTPYTSDVYDDRDVSGDANATIYFVSKRPYDTTKQPIAQRLYRISGKQITPLKVDTIPFINWDKPVLLQDKHLLATHTQYGIERFAIVNSQTGSITTLGAYQPLTYQQTTGKVLTHKVIKDSLSLYSIPVDEWIQENTDQDTTSVWLQDYRKREAQRAKEDSILKTAKNDSYTFLKGVLVPKDAEEQAAKRKDSIDQSMEYNPKKIKPYILQLHSAYFAAKANNDYFINRYQPFLNYQGQFKFPELGAMLQAGFTDLFEDQHVGIGFRIPTATEGSDFFVTYRNTKKNLNWGLTYFRKVETVQGDADRLWVNESGLTYPNLMKVKTHYYELCLERPITYYLSVGFNQAVRNDRTIFLATDKYSLVFEDIKSIWSVSTVSVKQYKLRPTLPLLHKGYTAKLLIDGFKAFSQKGDALYAVSVQGQYHQPIYKYITLVAKGQAGHSGGASHMLYNVAGMDNNVTVKVDSNVHFSQTAPYAFQSLVTPFRGYLQNKLYGNQYAFINADVYFPIFQTLIPIETPLSFINKLQLGIFSDAGTAKETWQKPEVKQGWLWSYGLSARSKLAGYTIRMDVAWPEALNKKPVWYFSLNSQ